MATVAFNNVTKRFDENTVALRQFSLYIEDGEFVVLVGPSGCGKSTALRLLAGLENVSDGEILIDGNVVNQLTPQQRNIAMVFQNYALYPHMSVRGNLEFPLRMAHTPARLKTEKVAHIAEILNLSDLLERRPKQLSGGQRQRVAMGRALVRDPNVLLLDEPLSNLDAKLRSQIRADIAHIQKRLHNSTLYVTHDQVEAMTLGDKVAVMNAGELQQIGTPETLYSHPHNIFVAKFIGNPGMNILPSKLVNEDGDNISIRLGSQPVGLSRLSGQASQGVSQCLNQCLNQSIFAGIRPESFYISQGGNRVGLKVNIQSVEFLGHESLVYFHLTQSHGDDPHILIARVGGKFHSTSLLNEVFYVDPSEIHIFDKAGLNICRKEC